MATTGGVILTLWPLPSIPLVTLFLVGMVVRRNPLTMFLGFGALPVYLWASGRPGGEVALAAGLYVFMMLRRLVGLRDDLRGTAHPWRVGLSRLVNDRRPGQTEYGRHQIGRRRQNDGSEAIATERKSVL